MPIRYGLDGTFLSTLSLRRATVDTLLDDLEGSISIHALLAESDCQGGGSGQNRRISIHALLAESDVPDGVVAGGVVGFLSTLSLRRATVPTTISRPDRLLFLSTLSLRRATNVELHDWPPVRISIHALLAESD